MFNFKKQKSIKKRRSKSHIKAFSYDKLFLPGQYRDRKRSKVPVILFFILLVLISVAGVYILFFSDVFRVQAIQVQNRGKVITLSTEQIRDRFVDLYGQNMWHVDTESLLLAIIKDNPRIHTIEAKKLWPSTIIFSFYEYDILGALQDPVALDWYLVNQNGLVVESHLRNPPSGLVQLTFLNDVAFDEQQIVFEDEDLEYLVAMMTLFHKYTGIPISSVAVHTISGEYRFHNTKDWTIWTDERYAPEQVISRLNTIVSQVDLGTDFEIIDLRIPNKAFVCYKDEGCQQRTPEEEPLTEGK